MCTDVQAHDERGTHRTSQQTRPHTHGGTLAEVATLRNAGYTARVGWTDHSGYTGIVAQVRCDNDAISECGEWVQPLFPLPGATTCDKCYADGMEQAGM